MRKKIVKLFLTCIISMVLIISSVLAPVIANTIQGELICTEEGHEHNNECYAINEEDKVKISENKNPTDHTFEDVIGDYTLKNILNNYNVFSFNDIEGGHIVGPVIAQNRVYKSNIFGKVNSSTTSLSVSDYSRGIPSYIGKIERLNLNSENSVASVSLNYGFEKTNPGFTYPNLYINYSDNNVKFRDNVWHKYKMVDEYGEYNSPNNVAVSPIFQNDKFINFEEAYSSIMDESQRLLKNKYNIDITNQISSDGCLEIDAGGNYIITDATNLKKVNIKYPKDYHPISNPYPYNTVINISSNSLSKITLGGKEQNLFPNIYINGEVFSGSLEDSPETENGQYGDSNSIVWNLPNITTDDYGNGRIVRNDESDILGHIVAPKAEFWSYEENSSGELYWVGGNNNGCAIVKSWHGGNVESHMWPYNEDEIGYLAGELVLNGTKIFDGFTSEELNDKEFKFSLEYDGDILPGGVLNQNIPQTVTQSNGVIEFLPLKFTAAGTYNFIIKEVIPENTDGIIYDKSEYRVKVEVTKGDSNNFNIVSTATKVKDENGKSVNLDTTSEIVFTNKKEQQDFSTSLDIQAKKEFIGGDLSTNKFEFNLDKFDNSQSLDGVENFSQTISQGDDGTIKFNPITFTKAGAYLFRIKEVTSEKNDGIIYDKSEYKIYVNVSESTDGLTASINKVTQVKDENGNSVNSDITSEIVFKNTKSDEVLPAAGGDGITECILIGMVLMITSTIIFIGKSKIEVRK